MNKLMLAFLFFCVPGVSSAQWLFGDAQVIRDGSIIVYAGENSCYAIDLDNIGRVVPEGKSTPSDVLSKIFNSRRQITAAELALCTDVEPPADEYPSEWSVAASDTGFRHVFSTNRLASGVLDRIETDQQLAVGEPCASDADNTFNVWYTGGDLMWRYIPGSAALIVYCSRD